MRAGAMNGSGCNVAAPMVSLSAPANNSSYSNE